MSRSLARRAVSTSAAALLATALAAAPALAQPTPAPSASSPAQVTNGSSSASTTGNAPGTAAPGAAAHAVTAAHEPPPPAIVERRITELHRQLHVTSAQDSQWNAFAQTMRSNAEHMQQVYAQQPNTQNVSALQDMQAYAAITEAQAQDMQNMLPAFEALYNSMTPAQKKDADNVFHQYARQRMAAERPTRHS